MTLQTNCFHCKQPIFNRPFFFCKEKSIVVSESYYRLLLKNVYPHHSVMIITIKESISLKLKRKKTRLLFRILLPGDKQFIIIIYFPNFFLKIILKSLLRNVFLA